MGAFVMTILTLLKNFYNIDIIKKLEGSSLIVTVQSKNRKIGNPSGIP